MQNTKNFKPPVNQTSEKIGVVTSLVVDVGLLANVPQRRQVTSLADLGGTSTLGNWTTGLARSSRMGSVAVSTAQTVLGSGQSGLTSAATSVRSVEVGQIAQNFSQQNTFGSGLLGSSANIGFMGGHAVAGLKQSIPVMGREESQRGQCETGIKQNTLTGMGPVGASSFGSPGLGAGNSATVNIQFPSTATSGYVVVVLEQSVPGMRREGSQRGQCSFFKSPFIATLQCEGSQRGKCSCFKTPFIATMQCSYKRGLKAATLPSL
jgi:hypothetical protein